jgi:hypothetical protein
MRYLSIWKTNSEPTPPSPEMMAKMGALIEEGMKSGWLIATEGRQFGTEAVRVTSKGGKITVVDGPFAEAKEVIGGYALMEARDRAHLLELTQKFLSVAGDGECEILTLYHQT